ncbi:MAG TPA: hypothetical protein VGL72_32520 [Bryobacteraceae bacterium]|jgi:cytoskeletal protein CcmA (bactofilin family)
MIANSHPIVSGNGPTHADINMSQIHVGGEIMGFLFAASTVYIFVAGIPVVRWFFAGAIAVGLGISLALRTFHRYKPVRPFPSVR